MIQASKGILPLVVACSLLLTSPAQAADQETTTKTVGKVYDVLVAPDQTMAFENGMKGFIACLKQNGSKDGFSAWEAETGTMAYVFTTPSGSWDQFDKNAMDPAGKACSKNFADNVLPHVRKMKGAVYVDEPKMSKAPADTKQMPKYVVVDEYDVRAGKWDAYKDAATQYTEAAVKSNWGQYWYMMTLKFGGSHAADVVVLQPADSWAEIGKPADPKAKAMLEGIYGKDKTEAIYKQFMSAVKHHTSNVYRYNKDLSYTPSN